MSDLFTPCVDGRDRAKEELPEVMHRTQSDSAAPASQGAENNCWHHLDIRDVGERLRASPEGLSAEEAQRRLAEHGPNELRRGPGRTWRHRLWDQIVNPLILVLVAAGGVTALLGHFVDAGVIFGVVIINAIVGMLQEGKAEKALESIRQMLSPSAVVLRDGARAKIAAAEVVPGDLVVLDAGDRVPADLRLVQARSLSCQEAALTGESLPANKDVAAVDADAELGDRRSLCYAGTIVATGAGRGYVVATGDATEIGRISGMVSEVEQVQTPLLRKLNRFAAYLTVGVLVLAAASFALGVLWRGFGLSEMFMAAVGIAVALIPEGLPPLVTITLALGVRRMAKRNAIVRRLPAVEALGSVTVICTDKTGTLTRNEMSVQRIAAAGREYAVSGEGYSPEGAISVASQGGGAVNVDGDDALAAALRAALLCSDASIHRDGDVWQMVGDPTEGALVAAAARGGIDVAGERDGHRRLDVIPFDSERKYMATLDAAPDGPPTIHVKGAPEVIMDRCDRSLGATGPEPIDPDAWLERVRRLSDDGLRVIAVARREAPSGGDALAEDDVTGGLVLVALFGLLDPPREEAVAAVARCRSAGIRVKMITGDHVDTAAAIARAVGIEEVGQPLRGRDLAAMNDAELRDSVGITAVFARAAPEHKIRLVQALQERGEICAMTGDGVNDAPALKRADIGVAMGIQGTEAAKEAADMVLADDNFATITAAVEEGRTIYDNIRKAITFILPVSGGQALVVLAAIVFGVTLPITPVQILWVNMVTAVTLGLALGFEPAEEDVMARPPRPRDEPLLSGFMIWRVLFVSVLMVVPSFGLFFWAQINGADLDTARTMAVNALVVAEILYLFNSRFFVAPSMPVRGFVGSSIALYSAAAILLAQAAFTYLPPLQALFNTAPLGGGAWLAIAGCGVAVFLCVEVEKFVLRTWTSIR